MSAAHHPLQFLCVRLGSRYFALDIMSLREILRALKPTPVPAAPPAVAGVLNVRGELVTVLDLAAALGVEGGDAAEGAEKDRRILLVRHGEDSFGLLVDAVEAVAALDLDALEPVPVVQGHGRAVVAMFRRSMPSGGDQVVLLVHLAVLAKLAKGEVAHGAD